MNNVLAGDASDFEGGTTAIGALGVATRKVPK